MKSRVYHIEASESDGVERVSASLRALVSASGVLDVIREGDFTAVKTHFGDIGNRGHIRSEWIAEAVKLVSDRTPNCFVSDSNVIYKIGRRANSVEHLKMAREHGFDIDTVGAPVMIADGLRGTNFTEVQVDGKHFKSVKIASDFAASDSMLAMSHMTGHILTGIGSAIKNIGMGCASRRGKYEQHCGAAPEVKRDHCTGCGICINACPAGCLSLAGGRVELDPGRCVGCGECAVLCPTKALEIRWSEKLENVQEKMVEYTKGVVKALSGRIAYITFLIRVTKDCDCLAKDDPRIVKDLGIVASNDPVAIDKASIDMVLASAGRDVFKDGYPETDWSVQLRYAERLGLGRCGYEIVKVTG